MGTRRQYVFTSIVLADSNSCDNSTRLTRTHFPAETYITRPEVGVAYNALMGLTL